ncbi:PREDICTED: actin cross-linking [Prunus dulcis]|uniref:PREDICTED: actin cross-linking n=1 Tax=Prunus dulcis TaxID=3755 RepID=A0A5E4FIJ6_PRUDU|nr:PREDICTED: actin cross-linking [Prunus dulcis]
MEFFNTAKAVKLRSHLDKCLVADDNPFLLGMTGRKVLQAEADKSMDFKFEWEPIHDGFQLKLRTWCGKYLRSNCGPPPWRNAVSHDDPTTSSTSLLALTVLLIIFNSKITSHHHQQMGSWG